MLILGDVLAVVASLFGICLSVWAMMVGVATLFDGRTAHAQLALESRPWKCMGWGVLLVAVPGLIGLALASAPNPLAKLVGTMMYLSLLAIGALGLAGLAMTAARRLRTLDPALSPLASLTRAAAFLVLPCLLPILGWFLFAPALLVAGIGAGFYGLVARERAVGEVRGMSVSRRDALKVGVASLGAAALAGCGPLTARLAGPRLPKEIAPPPAGAGPIAQLLQRAAYGPVPGMIAAVEAQGPGAWIDRQLAADQPEPPDLQLRLRRLDIFQFKAMELRDLPEDEVVRQLQTAAILRAVYSPNQLLERMVEFWSDHFNIYARKGLAAYRKADDERNVIRKHALGKFPDLLRASARSTAMLNYLDNQANHLQGPNENYARELLELHTMGVDGGYTQRDVQEVARCFTGWTEERDLLRARGQFEFRVDRHDPGEKWVLGHRIPAGGGISDGERVLEILAAHPSTARFVSIKICRFFLGDSVGEWPDRLAKIYGETGGDLRAMLRPLLLSDDLTKGAPIVKRPFDFMISALRALGAETDGGPPLQRHLEAMGQPLFQWPMPDGYPTRTAAWTGSLLGRWNFAFALARGGIPGTGIQVRAFGDSPVALLGLTHGWPEARARDERLTAHLTREPEPAMRVALALASPEFQWR